MGLVGGSIPGEADDGHVKLGDTAGVASGQKASVETLVEIDVGYGLEAVDHGVKVALTGGEGIVVEHYRPGDPIVELLQVSLQEGNDTEWAVVGAAGGGTGSIWIVMLEGIDGGNSGGTEGGEIRKVDGGRWAADVDGVVLGCVPGGELMSGRLVPGKDDGNKGV